MDAQRCQQSSTMCIDCNSQRRVAERQSGWLTRTITEANMTIVLLVGLILTLLLSVVTIPAIMLSSQISAAEDPDDLTN